MNEPNFDAIGRVSYELGEARKKLACLEKQKQVILESLSNARNTLFASRCEFELKSDTFVIPNVIQNQPHTRIYWPSAQDVAALLNGIKQATAQVRRLESEARTMGIPH